MRTNSDYSSIRRIASVEGVEVFHAFFARFAYAKHTHDTYALGTVDEGSMQFWHKGTIHAAAFGSVIAVNPGEVHDGRSGTPEGCRYRMLYIERETIERSFADDTSVRDIFGLQGPVLHDAWLAWCVHRLHSTLDRIDADSALPLEQQSRLMEFIHHLFTRYGIPRLCVTSVAAEKRCVRQAKEFLSEHVAEPIHLKDVADAVNLSPYYLVRTFRRSTGLPPHAYLNQLRLDRARAQLRRGESPAQIASALGFVDQSHFTRRFKAAFGITPGQYVSA